MGDAVNMRRDLRLLILDNPTILGQVVDRVFSTLSPGHQRPYVVLTNAGASPDYSHDGRSSATTTRIQVDVVADSDEVAGDLGDLLKSHFANYDNDDFGDTHFGFIHEQGTESSTHLAGSDERGGLGPFRVFFDILVGWQSIESLTT